MSAEGGNVLFVGTKRQAQETIAEEAGRAGMSYVNQRWLGGTLTNFATIKKSLARLRDLEEMASGERDVKVTKKEMAQIEKERTRLDKTLSGLKGDGLAPGGAVRRRPVLRDDRRSPRRTSSASR